MNQNRNITYPRGSEGPPDQIRQEVTAIQSAVENVTQNYLETLDALGTVYEAAAGFAQLFDSSSIAYYTLRRILESLELDRGAIFIEVGGALKFHSDSAGARDDLKVDAVEDASFEGRALFKNGADAIHYLRPEAGHQNVLLAPVVAAQRRLGIVVVIADQSRLFTTKDLKLVGAVTSQAAISLSGAQNLEQVLIERQKLRSILEDNAGGIVVLAPDGRTMLTNTAARQLLDLPADRGEGYSLVEELSQWKLSRPPESLCGEGPAEVALEMARGVGPDAAVISVQGRRVRGTDGELASIVLNLHDCTESRQDERMKRDFVTALVRDFQTPVVAVQKALEGHEPEPELRGSVDDLTGLAERLRGYAEVLEDSWPGPALADLAQLASETCEHLAAARPERSPQVELDFAASASHVGVHERCARIILENLLDHGLRSAGGPDAQVRVFSRRLPPDQVVLTVETRRNHRGPETSTPGSEATGVDGRSPGVPLTVVREAVRRVRGFLQVTENALVVTLPAAPPFATQPGEAPIRPPTAQS